jgi:c-di-GMP-binding flagellar brake protein YcgR
MRASATTWTARRDPVPVGSDIQVAIHCGGDTGDLAMSARAVRCDRIEEGERPWRLAVTFTDLTTAQEDRLVKFLFERQRELRGREAGLR